MFFTPPTPPPQKPIFVTVFVHGTDLIPKTIIKPFERLVRHESGMFPLKEITEKYKYTKVLRNICRDNPDRFPKESAYLFCWSGKLSHKDRLAAAKDLNKSINDIIEMYKNKKQKIIFTIITHSHGGNVVLNLSNLKEAKNYFIDHLILMAVPVQEKTKKCVSDPFFKQTTIYAIYSMGDMVQILDLQGAKPQGRAYRRIFSEPKNGSKLLNLEKPIPLFSERKFKSKKVNHIKVTSKKRPILHIEFLLPSFTKKISTLLEQAAKHNFSKEEFHFTF
ncbi:hypothetical protein K9K77_01720 [Candidatus Babeliales bacterium]|nr:hypothetical protein [Candidatus Babeliales bacterium]